MTTKDSTKSQGMNSIISVNDESDCLSNHPMLESSLVNFQKIVENNSYEYGSMYVRLLTTTTLLLTNDTTQHTLTQTKIGMN